MRYFIKKARVCSINICIIKMLGILSFLSPNAKLLIPVVAIKRSAPTKAKVHLNISNTEK